MIKLDDYTARAAKRPTAASSKIEQIQNAVTAPGEMVAGAREAADKGDLARALDLLRQVPAAIDRANLLLSAGNTYKNDYPHYQQTLAEIGGLDKKYTDPLAGDIALFRDLVEGADIAKTSDILASVQRIGGLFRFENRRVNQLGKLRRYVDTLPQFDTFCKSLAKHKGRFAIEPFYQRLLPDRQRAADSAARGEFAMAEKTILAAAQDAKKMRKRAEFGAKYREYGKALNKGLADLENAGEPELVAPMSAPPAPSGPPPPLPPGATTGRARRTCWPTRSSKPGTPGRPSSLVSVSKARSGTV